MRNSPARPIAALWQSNKHHKFAVFFM